MSYDPKTNTLYVSENSDVLADSGIQFVYQLKEDACGPRSTKALAQDWEVIATWLGCPSGELAEGHHKKIHNAWKAYFARGVAPSADLQDTFNSVRLMYMASNSNMAPHVPPPQVLQVFDRMLATPAQIAAKRSRHGTRQRAQTSANFRAGAPPKAGSRKYLPTTRKWRLILTVSAAWLVWVIFRTSGEFELFGWYLDRWDEDMFFANALIPIVLLLAGVGLFNWIGGAQK